MSTFLLTWNPDIWIDEDNEMNAIAQLTAAGEFQVGTWSTGSRTQGMSGGDRVFLLRQGVEPRGIVGSGWIADDDSIFQDVHFADPSRTSNYTSVIWELLIPGDDPLPVIDLRAASGAVNWQPQGSGTLLPLDAAEAAERLWAAHLTGLGFKSSGTATSARGRRRWSRSGWQNDPVRRKLVEDYAQELLEESFRSDGWTVSDTRFGNPFDAIARKHRDVIYLEAKGTESDGHSVEVTKGEVEFATEHVGQCIMGIVSGVRFTRSGTINRRTGALSIVDWDPASGMLFPTRFRWTPEDVPTTP